MEQDDFERLLKKRWKRYRVLQKCRQMASGTLLATVRVAGATAWLLRKMRLMKQIRKEKVAVE